MEGEHEVSTEVVKTRRTSEAEIVITIDNSQILTDRLLRFPKYGPSNVLLMPPTMIARRIAATPLHH